MIDINETVLSSALNEEGRLIEWAEKAANKQELNEIEQAISESMNQYGREIGKLGKDSAREAVSELIVKVIQPEVFSPITEDILNKIFRTNSYGEFDIVKIMNTPKNTLIAYENAARTGNVNKSYIDFTVGQVVEKSIQLEFEIDYDALKREGAFTVATHIMFALEEIRNKKFQIILDYVDSLIQGGDHLTECGSKTLTLGGLQEFTDRLDDNCETGIPMAVGLSTIVRNAMRVADVEKHMSDSVKDEVFRTGKLNHFFGTDFASVKAGRKTGKGEKLMAKDTLYGFCGEVGEMYTRGTMDIDSTKDMNARKIHFMISGIEFGVCITDLDKIYKLVITE